MQPVTVPEGILGEHFTAVVVARNESARLPYVLENLRCLRNVLVVDNFSEDNTPEIAEKYGRRSVKIKNVGGFIETPMVMDPIWSEVRTEYLLWCVCAELLPPLLIELYDKVSAEKTYDVVRVDRISITAGLPIPIDLPPEWLKRRYPGEVRFFRRGAVDYTGNQVHGRGKVRVSDKRVLRVGRGENLSIIQFRDYDAAETEGKHLIYNNELALQKFKAGEKVEIGRTLLRATIVFLLRYFIYGGWRFGALGFIHSYYRFHMELGIGFRVFEHNRHLLKSDIVVLHQNLKAKLLETWNLRSRGEID